ncbi:MAG: hypothetical protein U0414_11190 [Polyangiaceae bacterium]
MVDILLAGLIARSFGRRAAARGKSRAGAALLVFFCIFGTEILFAIWFAGPRYDRGSVAAGAILGWLLGAGLGSALGTLLTNGPMVGVPDEAAGGRECFECQKPIVDDEDGVACGGCKHALHKRCLAEHARAHRDYERKMRGLPSLPEPEPPVYDELGEPAPALRERAAPASRQNLAGLECGQCGREIVMRHEGVRCETCGDPLHRACGVAHSEKHFAPFRRAASRG